MILMAMSGGDPVSINTDFVEWYEDVNGKVVLHMVSGQTIALDMMKRDLDETIHWYGKTVGFALKSERLNYDIFKNQNCVRRQ